eukprot:gi/632951614/ref/XP_007891399.1/ PREDICTED: mediator of RNA polymerase II transcription subunit 1-like [Callorhinchus milii]
MCLRGCPKGREPYPVGVAGESGSPTILSVSGPSVTGPGAAAASEKLRRSPAARGPPPPPPPAATGVVALWASVTPLGFPLGFLGPASPGRCLGASPAPAWAPEEGREPPVTLVGPSVAVVVAAVVVAAVTASLLALLSRACVAVSARVWGQRPRSRQSAAAAVVVAAASGALAFGFGRCSESIRRGFPGMVVEVRTLNSLKKRIDGRTISSLLQHG